jgi:hypothetical protein
MAIKPNDRYNYDLRKISKNLEKLAEDIENTITFHDNSSSHKLIKGNELENLNNLKKALLDLSVNIKYRPIIQVL